MTDNYAVRQCNKLGIAVDYGLTLDNNADWSFDWHSTKRLIITREQFLKIVEILKIAGEEYNEL